MLMQNESSTVNFSEVILKCDYKVGILKDIDQHFYDA